MCFNNAGVFDSECVEWRFFIDDVRDGDRVFGLFGWAGNFSNSSKVVQIWLRNFCPTLPRPSNIYLRNSLNKPSSILLGFL